MNEIETRVRERLLALQDADYRLFQCRLMPTVAPETVIGVRTPQLRQLAKELAQEADLADYLRSLPHFYYDENNLHGFLLCRSKSFDQTIAALDAFLPYVDNWATCDLMRPAAFAKHLPELLPHIKRWLHSAHTYTVRFGLEMLMSFYLDDAFCPEYLELAAAVRSEEYYVNMMRAWFFATALAKQWTAATPYVEQRRLDTWTHNKTIQKALESYRVSDERKAYLRALKQK